MRAKSKPFYALLDKIKAIHDQKGDAYEGLGQQTYPNYRRLEKWVPALAKNPKLAGMIYAMMREEEKLARIRALLEGANGADESIEDSLLDMAVIPLIALTIFKEDRGESSKLYNRRKATGHEPNTANPKKNSRKTRRTKRRGACRN